MSAVRGGAWCRMQNHAEKPVEVLIWPTSPIHYTHTHTHTGMRRAVFATVKTLGAKMY